MSAYGDVWHASLGWFELARLLRAMGKSGFFSWGFVDRVSWVGGVGVGVGGIGVGGWGLGIGWLGDLGGGVVGNKHGCAASSCTLPSAAQPTQHHPTHPTHPTHRPKVVAVFSNETAATSKIAPDTLALMSEALALVDYAPPEKWMWEWEQMACNAIGQMTAEVGFGLGLWACTASWFWGLRAWVCMGWSA